MPLTKYNALLVTKCILRTAAYLSNLLLEIYILPLLPPIALLVNRRNEDELERYFIELGFR